MLAVKESKRIMSYFRPPPQRNGIAVYCLMLLIMVYVGRVHELIPGLGRVDVAKFAIALTLLFYFATPKKGGASIFASIQAKYILGILLMVILSIPFSVYISGSIEFLTKSFIKNVFFFFLIIAIVDTADDLDKVALAVVASVLSLSIAVLLVHHEARAHASNTYDPNDTAFVLVTFLPIVYYRMKGTAGAAKLALAGVIIVMVLACIRTVSRGGLLGLCVVGAAIYLKQGKSLRGAVLPLLMLVIVFLSFAPESYWHRMSTMMNPDADYNVTESTGRIDIWKRGLRMIATRPLGVGANDFAIAEGRMHEGKGKWSAPHNSFIQIGGELGVIGLYLFVKLLFSSIKSMRECKELDKKETVPRYLLDGIEVSFYGYMATGFFLTQAYSAVLYLLVAMAICARKAIERDVEPVALPQARMERAL